MKFLEEFWISIAAAVLGFFVGWAFEGFKKPKSATILLTVVMFTCGLIFELSRSVSEISSQLGTQQLIAKIHDPILRNQANAAVADSAESVRAASEGRAEFSTMGAMMDAYHKIFGRCKRDEVVFATSYVSITNVWNTQLGIDALNSNSNAVGRGVRIQRIFILPNANEVKAAAAQFGRHHEAGVEVFWVAEESIPERERRDFLATSSGMALEFTKGNDGSPIVAKYTIDPKAVNDFQILWDGIKARATRWRPQSNGVAP